MKASKYFRNTLKKGISLLIEEYGFDQINTKKCDCHCMQIYHAVHDSVTPGFHHNSRVEMKQTNRFHAEAKSLTDDNIVAAVKWAMKKQ